MSANTPNKKPPPEAAVHPDSDAGGADAYVLCGAVLGPHGVRGWLRIRSHTQPAGNLLHYQPWQLRAEGTQHFYQLEAGRETPRGLIVKLLDIHDRDQADTLRGSEVWIADSQFPPLPAGEYYHYQLLGLQAFDQQGRELGEVRRVLETGAHDVLLIQGDQEYLVPYVPDQVILGVDLASRRIDVRWDGITES